mmetsp:Transcript_11731/g.30095  ORF Transcript_11731/g.30095 Transcript_11731/m.30095 type:complete len:89 (+) Transcript_11731:1414-1680(+)
MEDANDATLGGSAWCVEVKGARAIDAMAVGGLRIGAPKHFRSEGICRCWAAMAVGNCVSAGAQTTSLVDVAGDAEQLDVIGSPHQATS